MFKRTIAAIMILAATLCPAVKVDAAERHKQDDTWLVYWYICGTDLESDSHSATADIGEMQHVKLPPNVKVLIYAGGTTKWHHPTIKSGGNGIYLYSSNRMEKRAHRNENMGDPNTLASFLKYGEENFPADHKIMIFWNHGGVSGLCYDEGNPLTYDELKGAFASVYGDSPEEIPFELIGFDLCLSGSYELANSISEFSHYMLGSEPSTPSAGWDYAYWFKELAKNPAIDGSLVGRAICNGNMQYYKSSDTLKEKTDAKIVSYSLIDLTKMPELREAYEEYFNEAVKRSNEEGSFSAAFARAAENRNMDKYSTRYADLGLLAKNTTSIMPATSNRLLKAIDKAVVYNKRGDYLKSKGISTYYPYISKEKLFSDIETESATNSRNTAFEIILKQNSSYSAQKELYSELLGLNLSKLQDENKVSVERQKGRLIAKLTSEQLESVSSIQCILIPVNVDGQFELGGAISISADDLKIDWHKGIATEKFRAVEPMFDGQRIIMYPSVSGRGHTFYTVPILYTYDEDNKNDVKEQRELVVRYDTSTKKYEIIGFGENIENGMVRANRGKPQPGHVITPLYMIISDDPANEQLGLTQYINTKTGKRVPLMSLIDSFTDADTKKTFYLKWKLGEPFVYTRNSAITNEPIKKGMFLYTFTFNAPNGDQANSNSGVIAVEKGKIFRLTTDEFAKALAESANK